MYAIETIVKMNEQRARRSADRHTPEARARYNAKRRTASLVRKAARECSICREYLRRATEAGTASGLTVDEGHIDNFV